MNLGKFRLLLFLCLISSTAVSRASDLILHLQDGSLQTVPLSNIGSLSFDATGTELQIILTNSTVHSLLLSEIGKLTFDFSDFLEPEELAMIQTFTLLRAYPNPFNSSTNINFDLPSSGNVDVIIYNIQGQKVRTLFSDFLPSGHNKLNWDGRTDGGNAVASGLYLCKVAFEHEILTTRLVYTK